jgi:hypothetical protein
MGLFSPKYPTGAAPAKQPKASRESRRSRQASDDASLFAFCDASTALHRARQDHGWDSAEAKAALKAFRAANPN